LCPQYQHHPEIDCHQAVSPNNKRQTRQNRAASRKKGRATLFQVGAPAVEVALLGLLQIFPTCISLANKALQNGRVQVEDQGQMASKVGI